MANCWLLLALRTLSRKLLVDSTQSCRHCRIQPCKMVSGLLRDTEPRYLSLRRCKLWSSQFFAKPDSSYPLLHLRGRTSSGLFEPLAGGDTYFMTSPSRDRAATLLSTSQGGLPSDCS
eukprot:441103-Karenia_brevis.AAC.1